MRWLITSQQMKRCRATTWAPWLSTNLPQQIQVFYKVTDLHLVMPNPKGKLKRPRTWFTMEMRDTPQPISLPMCYWSSSNWKSSSHSSSLSKFNHLRPSYPCSSSFRRCNRKLITTTDHSSSLITTLIINKRIVQHIWESEEGVLPSTTLALYNKTICY